MSEPLSNRGIAVVGMAGRFPGAPNVDALWRNLREGVEAISFFTDEELQKAGIPVSELEDPRYVKAAPLIEGPTRFDAAFFKYSAQEAELIDPQQRLFLECAVEALESAGCDPARYPGAIGVFGGVGTNTYKYGLWAKHAAELRSSIAFEVLFMGGNDSDFLSTRVSYKLGLRGPSLTTQTACSSSLVAVHAACQSLFAGEADMALAGGSSILRSYFKSGYRYEPGSIASPDGHCRPFDAQAGGTNFGDGVGIVVLKRLEDALAEGDRVHAVIRGTAINNDGSTKVGYNAPSVDGQAAVISEALAVSDVPADTIGYVEAHGTGTELGDPVEIAALTKAFRAETDSIGFCAVGSIKSNIGHLGAASGIAGLIKVVLMLKHGTLPPTLHFRSPNPNISFADSPFHVNAQTKPWRTENHPRRAGVSSFGVGGTNAHVILEEAPELTSSPSRRSTHILALSAATPHALDRMSDELAQHLTESERIGLADVAFTLAGGRAVREHRRAIVCRDAEQATEGLSKRDVPGVVNSAGVARSRPVVFMFPGSSSFRTGIGCALYDEEPIFRRELDRCAELLREQLSMDVRDLILAEPASNIGTPDCCGAAATDSALFAVSFALAQVWTAWGVRPTAMIGHGAGELVAACAAGVFRLDDAVRIVAARGRLIDGTPPGAMLAVAASAQELSGRLPNTLSFASHDGPTSCVVSGPMEAIGRLEHGLAVAGIHASRLSVTHALHSEMMAGIAPALTAAFAGVSVQAPIIPLIPGATGAWTEADEVCTPEYWARQLTQPVRFAEGMRTLLESGHEIFLEVGPGSTLATLAGAMPDAPSDVAVIASLPRENGQGPESETLYDAAARLWVAGAEVEFGRLYVGERRIKIPLPTYPFERQDYGAEIAAFSATGQHLNNTRGHHKANSASRGPAEGAWTSAEVQDVLTSLWSELAGQKDVKVDDELGDLGEDSLTLLRLVGRLSDAVGIEIPIHAVTEARTIADLSKRVEGLLRTKRRSPQPATSTKAPDVDGLVLLQSGSLPPVVLIHPIGGGVQCYDKLVRSLPEDQTVYAIHAFGQSPEVSERHSIERIAEAYLGLLKHVCANGTPPRLMGWSFGGTVAFEMARQLEEARTPAAFVALIDSQLPQQQFRHRAPDDEKLQCEYQRFVRLEAGLGDAKGDGFSVEAENDPAFAAFRAHYRALYTYRPQTVATAVKVFRASDQTAFADGWDFPWGASTVNGCEYISIPGNHFSIMEMPNVGILGRQMMQRLRPR